MKLGDLGWRVGNTHFPYTVQTAYAPKVRFSAMVGGESEIEFAPG